MLGTSVQTIVYSPVLLMWVQMDGCSFRDVEEPLDMHSNQLKTFWSVNKPD